MIESGLPHVDHGCRITFCVGAPRSGTTLVGSLLSEGPNVFPMLPECTFLTQLIRHYHDTLNYADAERYRAYVKSPENLAGIYAPAVHGFVRSALANFPPGSARELVLKDPELSIYLDLLECFFLDFNVVLVLRDPRSVVASFRDVLVKSGRAAPIEDVASQIFNYYWRALESKAAKSGRVHVVRYERIVQRDETEFAALERFLSFEVGRRGFGKVFDNVGKDDATYSTHYGRPITQPTRSEAQALKKSDADVVMHMFSGYNARYGWWEVAV